MKKIIITGASGFIGRNLINRLLSEECKIYAVFRKRESIPSIFNGKVYPLVCDLKNIQKLKNMIADTDIDVFYHFAWDGSTGAARGDYVKQLNNTRYTCDAALVSKEIGCKRFVSTGTITEKIVADAIPNNYLSENLLYAIAKDTAHSMLHIICNKNNIDYCWVQLSNIFGGDNQNGNLISYTLKEIEAGRIPAYGPCDQPYDFLYIKDAVEGLVKIGFAAQCGNNYFMGSGNPRILREYIELIAKKFHTKVQIGKRPSDGVIYREEWFDITSLQEELGFQSGYMFERALDEI